MLRLIAYCAALLLCFYWLKMGVKSVRHARTAQIDVQHWIALLAANLGMATAFVFLAYPILFHGRV